ncbi:hypothetical protein ACH5RR_024764 [Cinchona calisaya]|uniref:Uncharacterized protein n=1 Tax=Cinchona calisaya TaxID=153742 RepID=A0ABD2Z0V4_9GENT
MIFNSGLYRYRLGDILTVTGFHNNAPQFHFVQSRGVILSVDQDKTSEDDLSRTITRAIRVIEPLGLLLQEYTSYVDTSSIPGHYVLFWELQMRENAGLPWEHDPAILEQCCTTNHWILYIG